MKIVLNHKCNLKKEEFLAYYRELNEIKSNHEIVLCPSFIYLSMCVSSKLLLGSQDVGSYDCGAHTGDVAAAQLKSIGVEYAIVGHSERRLNHNEDNALICEKINLLLKDEIVPILCIGETKKEREQGQIQQKIESQLRILNGLEPEKRDKVIIAYEPIWAIGTGEVPEVFEIDEVLSYIREKYPRNILLYGGSANEKNISNLKESKYIEGYLLGGLSLSPEKLQIFLELC